MSQSIFLLYGTSDPTFIGSWLYSGPRWGSQEGIDMYTSYNLHKYSLNGDKFEHYRIGNNLEIENHSYKDPNGEVINEKEYIKDLGVYISSDLTWTRQINQVVSKGRSMAG